MKRYITNRRTSSNEANLRREEEFKAHRQHESPRILYNKPLTEQIKELMLSLPAARF
jgi:hypothetical protein